MRIDLHTHSYFSDGEYPHGEIILEAKHKGVTLLSITDHNVLSNTEQTKEYAEESGIYFIDGIEISTLYRLPNATASLHVLGYGKTLNRSLLNEELSGTIESYTTRARKIVDKLNKSFPTLCLDITILKKNSHETYISRNTLARLLMEHLEDKISIKDVLKQHVFVKEDDSWMMTPEKSFDVIKKSGGISVLAHSGRELRKIGMVAYESMIQHFVHAGLRGLEVYYPKHSADEVDTIHTLAKKYNLHITGGSDWHGKMYTPDTQIGMDVPEQEILHFLNEMRIVLP